MALSLVDDQEVGAGSAPAGTPDAQKRAAAMLMLAIGSLSKRALVALSNLFTLALMASAWWLWFSIPDPSSHQLIALGMYALFVLSAISIVKRSS